MKECPSSPQPDRREQPANHFSIAKPSRDVSRRQEQQPFAGGQNEPHDEERPIHGPPSPASTASDDLEARLAYALSEDYVERRYGRGAELHRATQREYRLAKRYFKSKLGKKEYVRQLRNYELRSFDFDRWLHPEQHPEPTPEEQARLDAWHDRFMRENYPERYRRLLEERDRNDRT